MMSQFAGKTVILTGASSGLGRGLALDLARRGANLVLFDRNVPKLEETAHACQELETSVLAVGGDVSVPEDCHRLVEEGVARFRSVDYLITNAGISMWAPFEEVQDLSIFRRLVETNYLGAVYCTHCALPHLRRSRGLIVAISSIQGKIGVPFHTGYVASKHALQGFFDTLRMELAGSGVDILLVLPHWLRGTGLRENALGQDGRALGASKREHNRQSVSVEACGQAIIEAMEKRRRELVIPAKLKALPWLKLIHPRIVEHLVSRKVREQK